VTLITSLAPPKYDQAPNVFPSQPFLNYYDKMKQLRQTKKPLWMIQNGIDNHHLYWRILFLYLEYNKQLTKVWDLCNCYFIVSSDIYSYSNIFNPLLCTYRYVIWIFIFIRTMKMMIKRRQNFWHWISVCQEGNFYRWVGQLTGYLTLLTIILTSLSALPSQVYSDRVNL
jgi:hypothetical protein